LSTAITDDEGNFRLGKKYKGTPLDLVPAYALAETRNWAQRVVEECQEELDRRVAQDIER